MTAKNRPRGTPRQSHSATGARPGPAPAGAPRRRLHRVAPVAALVLLAAAAAAFSTVRVRDGERAFRSVPGGGPALRLESGRHLAIPGWHRVTVLSPGPVRTTGSVPVRAREGIDLEIPFDVAAEIGDQALAALLGGGGEPRAALLAAAGAAVRSWARDASGETLVLLENGAQVEQAARLDLEARGFHAVTLRLGKVRGPAEVVAAIEGRALRDRLADTGRRIALIGLDGADWEIIDPLIRAGELPVLARLKARGAWGNMKTMSPALSPLLWTSVTTGKPPEEHGIIDFLVKDARTGQAVPVSSRWRRVKALWNIFGDAGKRSAFVAWWATWPAEPVEGFMVSDRVAYSLFGFEAGPTDHAGATHPPGYFDEMRGLIVDDDAITLAEVRRFARVDADEFRELRRRVREDPATAYREPVNHLTKILASAKTYHAIGLDILGRGQPDLFSVYYQGIDEVCHRFAHFMPPKMDMVTPLEFGKYRDAVFAYYRYQDRLLGELLARLAPDTTVIVLSDHGFKSGSGRPADEPPYIEGNPGLWHRRYGVLILAGPGIRPGRLDTSQLIDVAPTVLYLAGLPVADDMDGRVLLEAIDDDFRARFPPRRIPSYEAVGRPLARVQQALAAGDADREMIERLRSLGYVGGDTGAPVGTPGPAGTGGIAAAAPDGQALMTGHLNEASRHLANKDYRRAEAAVGEVLGREPEFIPALLLSGQIHAAQKRWRPAIEAVRKVLDLDPEGEKGAYVELGRIYAQSGLLDEGLSYLGGLARGRPRVAEIRAAHGSLLLKAGRTAEAEAELLEALRLDPALAEPLTELHTIYRGTDRVLGLEPIVRRGLERNGKSIVHRNWMGIIHEWRGRMPEAEAEFLEALELDPDYAATMANLGALYGRTGRLREAVDILDRAVGKDPDNLEAWVNLGAAQGRLGRSKEAIEALETARRKGVRTTTLYNALALSYFQDRQRDKAVQYLRESLALDPGQQDANELLKAMSRP
jgi:predicted AlkP superfamily phosphohydrolase/phosphomutase/Flp pilus assembly protein TadD